MNYRDKPAHLRAEAELYQHKANKLRELAQWMEEQIAMRDAPAKPAAKPKSKKADAKQRFENLAGEMLGEEDEDG